MLNSLSYQPFLISRLQDLTYAAGYIETCLLETSPEPELLKLVLSDVSQALAPQTMTNQKRRIKYQIWLNYLRYHLVRAGGLCLYRCEFYSPKTILFYYIRYYIRYSPQTKRVYLFMLRIQLLF